MRIPALTVAAGIVATLPSLSATQSFDCGKATTAVEKMICADRELSSLDEEMAQAFADARKHVGAEVLGQASWLRNYRNGCPTADCLKVEYRWRIAYLKRRAPSEPFTLEGIAGEWTRVGTSPQESAHVTIDSVGANAFVFSLSALLQLSDPENFRSGEIEGEATVRGLTAVYRDEDTKCEVSFSRRGPLLVVATEECAGHGGMGVSFEGEYQKQ